MMEGNTDLYFNKFKKSRWQHLLQTFHDNKLSSVVILIFILIIFSIIIFNPFKAIVNHILLLISVGWISPWIISLIRYWLYEIADELNIQFRNEKIIISYPKPKKRVEIRYENISRVFFNKLSSTNEAAIEIPCDEKDLNRLGIEVVSYEINSLSVKEWQKMARSYGFILIIDYILLAEDIEICTYYILSKKTGLITAEEINQIILENNIDFLGQQECVNCDENEFRPIAKYLFNTKHGEESFQFYQDKIMITYRKGKKAKEIYDLAAKYLFKVEKI